RISIEAAAPEHRSISAYSYRIIKTGNRQNLNVVHYSLDALDPSHPPFSVLPRNRFANLSVKRHGISFNLICEVVEDSVIRQRNKLLANLLHCPLLGRRSVHHNGRDREHP